MSGLCECGCGETTPVATYSAPGRGYFEGRHVRFVRGHHRRRSSTRWVEEDRGHDTPCWVWQLTVDKNGYARTGWGPTRRGSRPAHRAVYEERVGPVPDGLHLDHLCRVRNCVNPDHLEPVTNMVNARRGAATRLTWALVDEMRALLARGVSQSEVGRRYGVSISHMSRIANGAAWQEETR